MAQEVLRVSLEAIWNRSGLLFGKMWEDPELEAELLAEQIERKGSVEALCVASAGDTAFFLASQREAKVTAIDINPAQIHLCHLKQAILSREGGLGLKERLYRDASVPKEIEGSLPEETRDFWRTHSTILSRGLNRAGRVDRMMSFWVKLFSYFVVSRQKIGALLSSSSPLEQRELFEESWKNWKWDLGFRLAFQKWILRWVYGSELIEKLPPDFQEKMKVRVEHFLTTFPASDNPFLWQTFSEGELESSPTPYLERFGPVEFRVGTLKEQALSSKKRFDFIALSNILEVAGATQCQETLMWLRRLAQPGALLCLRFMAPRPPVFSELEFLAEESERLAKADRACFCNLIQVYRFP